MSESLVGAINAVTNVQPQANNVSLGADAQKTNSVSFEDILAHFSSAMGSNLKQAESLSLQQMTGGEVNMRNVVDSVMSAERSLTTAIAIRDKIVQAYLEVSRMQI